MSDARPHVTVIGGGLAGTEAAVQLARRGVEVTLYEMRPAVTSGAHSTGMLAELVCSNSFKSDDPTSAAGALKSDLAMMGSVVLDAARSASVPAGGALAVDRDMFARTLTELVETHPLVTIVREEVTSLPAGPVIIATGPLTSPGFEAALTAIVGPGRLAFYDAAAPVIEADSIDREVVFAQSRYDKGEGADYLNAPLTRDEYQRFHEALISARRVVDKEFERSELFTACQPVEEVARTGSDALRFGAMKPVGLTDPRSGERPWAVVQLRAENREGTAFNLVGFQTNLAWPEQERVFSMIPGLEHAVFARFGVMHRNTFVDAPRLLDETLALRTHPHVRIAGQVSGTEGYLEAAASGLLAAVNTFSDLQGLPRLILPRESVLGALVGYATDPATRDYQPMHVNYGIVPPLPDRVRGKRERYAAYAQRSAETIRALVSERRDLFPTKNVS